MKPTQQEIIELAREASGHTYPEWLYGVPMFALERLVHLALERFGAGGGEPVAFVHWPLSGAPRLVWYGYKALNAAILKAYEGHQPDMLLYTHPSPTDLQAAYARGLEDATKVARAGYDEFWKRHDPEFPKARYDQASVLRTLHATVEFVSTDIADGIEALKGKQ